MVLLGAASLSMGGVLALMHEPKSKLGVISETTEFDSERF